MHAGKVLFALIATSLLASLTVIARADSVQGITDTTIKIGILGPFSGESSVFDPLNYGPDAYLRYINAQGGVNGRKFETVFADSACNEAKGIAAAKKLIYEDKVFMIMGNPCSGVAMAIKPMLEKEGVPWIGISANPKLTTPPVPGMFHATYTGVQSGSRHGELRHEQAGRDQDRADRAQQRLGARLLRSGHRLHQASMAARSSPPRSGAGLDRRHRAGAADQGVGRPGGDGLPVSAGTGDLPARDADIRRERVHRRRALGADFEQTVHDVGDPAAVRGKFFQPYQFKAEARRRARSRNSTTSSSNT